jgi:dienelactone hydrolase
MRTNVNRMTIRLALSCALALAVLAPSGARAALLTVVPASAGAPAVPIYLARPSGAGPFPAVVLLHGCDGINGFAAVAADRLAARGFVTVAIDSLGAEHPEGVCGASRSYHDDEAAAARATLAWLRTQPYVAPDRLAVIGSSMGGSAVLSLVDPKNPDTPPPGLRAAIAFYPACEARSAGNLTVPLQIFIGGADRVTPAAVCEALGKAGKGAGKAIDVTVYPGATHAFQVPGPDRTFFGEPIHYDADAASDSALKTYLFLQSTIGTAH